MKTTNLDSAVCFKSDDGSKIYVLGSDDYSPYETVYQYSTYSSSAIKTVN